MEQPAGYANPSESLLSMLRQLQKDHVELKASFLKLNEDHTAKTERCEAAEAKLTHWRGEAERLIELVRHISMHGTHSPIPCAPRAVTATTSVCLLSQNQAKERVVEQYAQLLALHEPESTAVTIRSSAQDTSWQIPGVEQRLAKKEAEVAAMVRKAPLPESPPLFLQMRKAPLPK